MSTVANPLLSKGSRGDHVRTWQTYLNEHGGLVPLVVDGKFENKTKNATIAFQAAYALVPIDGKVHPAVWNKMRSIRAERAAPEAPSAATAGSQQERQQQLLAQTAAQGASLDDALATIMDSAQVDPGTQPESSTSEGSTASTETTKTDATEPWYEREAWKNGPSQGVVAGATGAAVMGLTTLALLLGRRR